MTTRELMAMYAIQAIRKGYGELDHEEEVVALVEELTEAERDRFIEDATSLGLMGQA